MGASSSRGDAPPADGDTRVTRGFVRMALAFGLLSFAVQLAEIPWRNALRGYDNTFNYLWLRSLAVDGDWDFANDIAEATTLDEISRELAHGVPLTPVGRVANKYGIGWAVLSVPGYLTADLAVRAGNAVGLWTLSRDGFNPVYQICLQAWHLLLALAALALARMVIAAWVDERWATAGIVTVWLASPLLYYQTSNLAMSHNAAFFAVTLAAFGLMRGVKQPAVWWPWLLAGVGFGLAATTRYQTAVFGLLAIGALITRVRQVGARGLGAAGWIGLGAMPFIAVQICAWHTVYGRWLIFSYGAEAEKFNWADPAGLASLFSPWHGLFYWHPLLLVSAIGLGAWALLKRGPALALVGAATATWYVNAAWWCWWFAGSFGGRAYDAALLALMAGQAFLFARLPRAARTTLWVVCGLLALWNVYVFALYRTGVISRNQPVTWLEMLQAAGRLPQNVTFE